MLTTKLPIVALCLLVHSTWAGLVHPWSSKWIVGQPVKTHSGIIVGHAAPNATQTSEYLAIPYAQPPLGSLRFQPPVKYTGTKTINSTSFNGICPHVTVGLPGLLESPPADPVQFKQYIQAVSNGVIPTTEDCLYLNVWTKPQIGEAKKAVMVWIHPGGFRSGGALSVGTNGKYLADKHDVVVVTFNYRAGALGFPGYPLGEMNIGLKDQRMALEWVRDNIAAFGGDVNRIVIFGESAGAASIDYYNYIYTADPIISASILQSGSTALGAAVSQDSAEAVWRNASTSLGCVNSTNEATLECMQNVNITDFIAEMQILEDAGVALHNPIIDNITVWSDSTYTTLQRQGKFIHKPILIGNNDYEAGWFKITTGQNQPESYWENINLSTFTCVSENLATLRLQVGQPAWRYRFYPVFPDTAHPFNSTLAIHTSELLLVFGTGNDSVPSAPVTADETTLSNLMMGYWATFAKNSYTGLDMAGWPRYDQHHKTLALLGYDGNYAKPVFVKHEVTDSACSAVVKVHSRG